MLKMRSDIVRVINEILKQITWCDYDDIYYRPIELHKMIIDFCREYKSRPCKLKCKVDHYGRLYINDIYISHIAKIDDKYRKIKYDDDIYYLEGKILEKQDRYY